MLLGKLLPQPVQRPHSPKSMRSLWLRCSRARRSCLSGAEVSRGMLGWDQEMTLTGQPSCEVCGPWGPRLGEGHLRGHQCLVPLIEEAEVLGAAGLLGNNDLSALLPSDMAPARASDSCMWPLGQAWYRHCTSHRFPGVGASHSPNP